MSTHNLCFGSISCLISPLVTEWASLSKMISILFLNNKYKHQSHKFQGYRLYYTTDATQPLSSWNTQVVTSGVTMATIGGILPERRYSVRILAYNGFGDGPLSDVLEVLTFTGSKFN